MGIYVTLDGADLFGAQRELKQFLFLCKSGEWLAFSDRENLDYENVVRVSHIAVQLGFRRLSLAMLMGIIKNWGVEKITEYESRYSEKEQEQRQEKWISDFYAQQENPFKRWIIERRLHRMGDKWKIK